MKPSVKYALMGVGGLVLLFGSFVIFAALSGAPLHEVAIVKNFVHAPEGGDEDHGGPAKGEKTPAHESGGDKTAAHENTGAEAGTHETEGAAHAPSPKGAKPPTKEESRAIEASVGALGAFLLPSPFSADELTDLQREVRAATRGAKERLAKIEERERALDEYERSLEQRYTELVELRQKLEKKEFELGLREEEVKRDLDARNARDAGSWKELAKFFEEGDPGDLAEKLAKFEPKEAVKILRSLDDERASQIVNALPAEKYHEYLQAYRSQTVKEPK